MDQFQKLLLEQQDIQAKQSVTRLPKWFFPQSNNIYKYFVLLHDAHEVEISKYKKLK
jgi:hypothetical protein